MVIINWLKKRIIIYMFLHNIGKLSHQYSRLTQQTERYAFLMEKFGGAWSEIAEVKGQGDPAPMEDRKKGERE